MLVSGASWDGVKGSERQLAQALGRYADLLWVDPPVSPATPRRYQRFGDGGRRLRARARELAPGVFRLTPVVLPGLSRPVLRLATWPLVRAQLRAALRRLDRLPTAVIACSFDDVLRGWPPSVQRILYGTDDWVAGAELLGQPANRLRQQEKRALAAADVVLAVTPTLATRWRELGAEAVVLPNGVDPDAYQHVDEAEPAPLPAGFPTPVAGMIGQLNDRTDVTLLDAVARSGLGVLLVGPCAPGWAPPGWAQLLARPNVHHAGAVAFEELPAWLCRMDVGLTPYADTAFNRASFPLKTLEYLASGRPVVGTDLPATRMLAQESPDVAVAAGPAEFVRAVHAAVGAARTGTTVGRCRAVARRHSWAARAELVAYLLDLEAGAGEETGNPATNRPGRSMHQSSWPRAGRHRTPRRSG